MARRLEGVMATCGVQWWEGPDCCTSTKLQVLGLQTRATPRLSWQDHVAGGWAWSLQGLRWGLRGPWKAGRGSQYLTGSEFPDCASGNPKFPTGYHGINWEVAQGS